MRSIKPEELDREVGLSNMGMGKMTATALLPSALIGNNYAHISEILALNGMMGNKGYPF